jgi:hypothetical protein
MQPYIHRHRRHTKNQFLIFRMMKTRKSVKKFRFFFAITVFSHVYYVHENVGQPGELSRYCDWLRAGRPRGRSSSPGRVKNFLFFTSSRPALRSTKPPIHRVPEALSPGVKRLGREAHHSPPTTAEVKKIWIYIITPPYAFMA